MTVVKNKINPAALDHDMNQIGTEFNPGEQKTSSYFQEITEE